jgi:putative membrane protein
VRRTVILAAVAGAIGFTVLLEHVGIGAIVAAMRTLGWTGFAAVVAFHLGVIALVGFAWSLLARDRTEGRPGCFVWGRLIRDSSSETLPFSQVGGFVMGARAASLCGVPGRFAAASTIVDMTVEMAARVPYMVLGLGLLVWRGLGDEAETIMLVATLLIAAGAVVCVVLLARGADLIAGLGARMVPQWMAGGAAVAGGVLDMIHTIQARRAALARALLVHCCGWVLSGVEVALPLWLMGKPVWIGAGIAIDCLVSGIRSAAFLVPSAIGVQEGAYVVVCGMFGIDPQVALALSLLRRGRDFAIGIPALLAWQMLEGQMAWRDVAGADASALLLPAQGAPRGGAEPDGAG